MRDVLSFLATPYYALVDFALDAPALATTMATVSVVVVAMVLCLR